MNYLRGGILSLALLVVLGCSGGGDELTVDDSETTTAQEDESETVADEDTEVDASGDADLPDPSEIELAPVAGCQVRAGELDLTPVWAGQNPGLAVVVSRDGEELFTTQPASREASGNGAFSDVDVQLGETYVYSVLAVDLDGNRSEAVPCGSGKLLAQRSDVACGVRISDAGFPEISWEGVLLVQEVAVLRDGTEVDADVTSPFVDGSAPTDGPSTYSIVVADSTDQGRETQAIDCGDVTPNVADVGGVTELASAIAASDNFPSPYQYVILEPICPDCSGTAELYLTPGDVDPTVHETEQVWIGGSPSNDRGELWMIDPLIVADALNEAQRNGSTITYDIDRDTGLIRSWTIDGVGARYECLEVDTRPIDMRTERCASNLFTG